MFALKRKLLNIILAALMVVGMMPFAAVPAFAEEPEYLSETIAFNNSSTAESEHFTLTGGMFTGDGWFGGSSGHNITIAPKNSELLLIRNIEAVVAANGSDYGEVGISAGTKRETGSVEDGITVHIDGVDALSFSFAGGKYYAKFKDITVFYEVHTHAPVLISAKEVTETEHGISTSYYYCEGCKQYFSDAECTNVLTKETVDSYTVHDWVTCSVDAKGHHCTCAVSGCSATTTIAHTGYTDDGVCDVCGYSGIFAETIVFNNERIAEGEHFRLFASRVNEFGYGWYAAGEDDVYVTIKKNKELLIKNIEAVIGAWGLNYDTIRVSKGTKREPGRVADGSTVHIDNVGADYFFFFGGIDDDYVLFKDITVYFCNSDTYDIILGAKAAIDAAAGENPSRKVRAIVDFAKEDIDKSLSLSEIMAIRDECIADIERLTGTAHGHTFSTEWSYNELTHWHEATCEHTDLVSGFGAHTFGTDGKCTVCGYEKQAGEKKYTVVLTGLSNPDKNYSGATDDSGICNIENIENGTYLMAISCEGAVTRTYTTEITDSTVRQDIELYDNGDVNGDGEITVEDYSAAVNAALSGENTVPEDLSLDADYSKAVADIDCDGVVDVLDIAMLERKIFA